MTGADRERLTLAALEQAGAVLLTALGTCPADIAEELADIAWRVGNLAAKIDPYTGEETETDRPHPFGAAAERGN